MRLSTYHKQLGDTVTLARDNYPLFENYDKTYISCIFRWNRESALRTSEQCFGEIDKGGTGFDIDKCLPDIIQNLQPDYEIYPECNYAIGFISRGCIRKCKWCVVPRKEGDLKRVSTAQEIVGEKKRVIFLDNNFLALPDYEVDLKWLAEKTTMIDFNQGLDARLVDKKASQLLAACKWYSGIRLALDSNAMINHVQKAIDNLEEFGVNPSKIRIYTLMGFAGFESDVERLIKINEWGCAPFPMGYVNNNTGEKEMKGWDKELFKKYIRLISRLPMAKSVWRDFRKDSGYK